MLDGVLFAQDGAGAVEHCDGVVQIAQAAVIVAGVVQKAAIVGRQGDGALVVGQGIRVAAGVVQV
ncbi:hypothetical protein D3C87_1670680 [compost metagenome]